MRTINTHFGVPQCKNFLAPANSMHRIPKNVMNKKELIKWQIALKMGKPFSKKKRTEHEDKAIKLGFPTENLLQSTVGRKECVRKIKDRYKRLEERNREKISLLKSNY